MDYVTNIRPLAYENLKIILIYSDANTRFRMLLHIPSIRVTDRLVPLRIENIQWTMDRKCLINGTSYSVKVVLETPRIMYQLVISPPNGVLSTYNFPLTVKIEEAIERINWFFLGNRKEVYLSQPRIPLVRSTPLRLPHRLTLVTHPY